MEYKTTWVRTGKCMRRLVFHLKSWRTSAPEDGGQVAVADALVQTRTGQAGVTLSQDQAVHVPYTHTHTHTQVPKQAHTLQSRAHTHTYIYTQARQRKVIKNKTQDKYLKTVIYRVP